MKIKLKTLLLAFPIALVSFNAAAEGENTDGGIVSQVAPGSLTANQGSAVCTAAVNADGTLANKSAGSFAKSSSKVVVGTYNVTFKAPCNNITAARGYARFVQVDTLSTGTTDGFCATADLSGQPNGI